MEKKFYCLGILGGIGLTFADAYTSWKGFGSLMPHGGLMATVMPIVVAMVALAMNGAASTILAGVIERRGTQFEVLMTLMIFFACVSFDLGSSWVGFINEFAGKDSLGVSLQSLDGGHAIAASVVAFFVTMGPFITTMFHRVVMQHGGFMACIFDDWVQPSNGKR